MNNFVNSAYDVTSQVFGSDSGIPWWAWLLVVVAVSWRFLVPERRTAKDRELTMAAAMIGVGGGKSGRKKDKKKKR